MSFEDDCLSLLQGLQRLFLSKGAKVESYTFTYQSTIIPHSVAIGGDLGSQEIGEGFCVREHGKVIARVEIVDPNAPELVRMALHSHVALSVAEDDMRKEVAKLLNKKQLL